MFAWFEASAVSGLAFGVCDMIAQCGERVAKRRAAVKKEEKDPAPPPPPPREDPPIEYGRLARFTALGALYGPVLLEYYRLLEFYFPGNVWAKILIGATVYNPVVLTVYISLNQIIKDGGAVKNVFKALREQFPHVVLTGAGYWLIIDFVNFSYVPLVHRVLFTRSFGIIFDVYLTHASNHVVEEVVEEVPTTV